MKSLSKNIVNRKRTGDKMKKFKVIVPARMASVRLPGKPLMDIQGKPMIIRVAEKCIKSVGIENVLVSTPDDEIVKVCDNFSVPVIKSSIECKTGTDRMVELLKLSDIEYFVNIQGDEPMVPVSVVKAFIDETLKYDESCVGYSKIYDSKYIESNSVVKVAVSNSKLVYASRSKLPIANESNEIGFMKHTGLYAFKRGDLEKFGKFVKGPLETAENVEILRMIENRISIRAVEVPNFGRAVDSLEDYEFVNKYGDFN
jgi:3-deoxy-manno-octulosonate cytidylyltransferase (CMP-KDO synthetase)